MELPVLRTPTRETLLRSHTESQAVYILSDPDIAAAWRSDPRTRKEIQRLLAQLAAVVKKSGRRIRVFVVP